MEPKAFTKAESFRGRREERLLRHSVFLSCINIDTELLCVAGPGVHNKRTFVSARACVL